MLALLGFVLYQARDQLSDVEVTRVHLGWLPVLFGCTVLSAAGLVAAQAALLGCGRWLRAPGSGAAGPAPGALVRTTLMATALAYVLPGGPAVSSAYAARRYQRYSVSAVVAAQSQVATAAASGIALGLVALAGLLVPGAPAAAGLDGAVRLVLPLVSGSVLLLSAGLALLVRSQGARSWLASSRLVAWVTGCPPPRPGAALPPVLGLTRLGAATLCTLVSQLWDVGCLAAGLRAAGVEVPWQLLLLAYGAAQLLGLLPLTPGGAGLLEGGLGALLVVPEAPGGAVALAVLLYRSFSWGLWVLAGGVAAVRLGRSGRATGMQATAAIAPATTG